MSSGLSMPAISSQRLEWDRPLFRFGDDPDEICPSRIDVTGPPRILFFGPFRWLDAGVWRAEIYVHVCAQAARRSYLVEFGSGQDLSLVRFGPLTPGLNRIAVEHPFESPATAEIRFWVARAAFHGDLCLLGVTLEAATPHQEDRS
jgi:hypothetical protein